MSFNILHRLKFSIRNDVLLLILFVLVHQLNLNSARANNVIPSEHSRGLTLHGDLSDINMYESIHRILRDEESHTVRKENQQRLSNIDASASPLSADTIATANVAITNRRVRRDVTTIIDSNDFSDFGTKINSTKIINLSNRNLSDINIKAIEVTVPILSDILVVNISNNNISLVNADTMNNLSNVLYLDLSANNIESFNGTFNKLIELNLAGNKLTSFHSELLPNVKVLDLSCNNFSNANDLDLKYLNNLERVDLSCNQLRNLNAKLFQKTINVKILSVSCNQLNRILKNYFFNLMNLEVLRLSHNNISEIEIDTFAYLPNLQYLDLSYNRIDASSIRALQGIPDLIGLSLAYNRKLGDALQGFIASWSLKELDASGTGLCQIPAALAQSVHTLNISDNFFQVIRSGDLDSYPLLQNLDVSSSEIMEVEDDALGRLEILVTLNLGYNQMTRIPTSLPSSLVHLYLQHNQITDIQPSTFVQLTNLEMLNLAGNKITYLPGLPLPKLLTLNMRTSGLKRLSQSVVKFSPNLKDLLLDGNPVKCSELLGVAEWATPCRSEKTFELVDTDPSLRRVTSPEDESILKSFRISQRCLYHSPVPYTDKPICAPEKLITSSSKKLNSSIDQSVPLSTNDNKTINVFQQVNNETVESTSNTSKQQQNENRIELMPHSQINESHYKNDTESISIPIPADNTNSSNAKQKTEAITSDMGNNNVHISMVETNQFQHAPALDKFAIPSKNKSSSVFDKHLRHMVEIGSINTGSNDSQPILTLQMNTIVSNLPRMTNNSNKSYAESRLAGTPSPAATTISAVNNKAVNTLINNDGRFKASTFSNKSCVTPEGDNNDGNGCKSNGTLIGESSSTTSAIAMAPIIETGLKLKHNKPNKDKLIENETAARNSISSTIREHHASSINVAKVHSVNVQSHPMDVDIMHHSQPIKSVHLIENNVNNDDDGISNTSALNGRPEQWNDLRISGNHPGLFVIIAVISSIVVSLGLIHIYRCRNPRRRRRNQSEDDDDHEHYPTVHRDLLTMDILNSSSIHYTDTPIDLW